MARPAPPNCNSSVHMAGPSKKLSWRILILLGVILTGLVYISFLNLINVESNFSFFADPREELHKTEKILPVEIKVDSNIPKVGCLSE